jgi:hypothetical protein
MSIEALKASLPDLTNEKFDQVYRQFFLKALGPVLGYERAKSAAGEDWDQVMDVFASERERRERAKELVPKTTQPGEWDAFCKRFEESTGRPLPPKRRPKILT